jgi:hypothetical protein
MCNYIRQLIIVLIVRKVYVKHVFKCGVLIPCGWHRHAETFKSSEITYFYVLCNCALTWFYKWKLNKMHGLCNFTIPHQVNYWRQSTQALLLHTIQSFMPISPMLPSFTRVVQMHCPMQSLRLKAVTNSSSYSFFLHIKTSRVFYLANTGPHFVKVGSKTAVLNLSGLQL